MFGIFKPALVFLGLFGFFLIFRSIRNIKSFFTVLVGSLRCVISFSALN